MAAIAFGVARCFGVIKAAPNRRPGEGRDPFCFAVAPRWNQNGSRLLPGWRL